MCVYIFQVDPSLNPSPLIKLNAPPLLFVQVVVANVIGNIVWIAILWNISSYILGALGITGGDPQPGGLEGFDFNF